MDEYEKNLARKLGKETKETLRRLQDDINIRAKYNAETASEFAVHLRTLIFNHEYEDDAALLFELCILLKKCRSEGEEFINIAIELICMTLALRATNEKNITIQ